jgi:hypothetical protein
MKKILSVSALLLTLLSASTQVFASSQVAEMATTKGGRHVAECAQKMDKGVSECAKLLDCAKEM